MPAKGTSESPAQGKKIGTSPALEGDFNRDGKPDIAVTSDISNTVSVLLGNGSGGFNPPTSVAVGQLPGNLISADLNGDNILDLVTANALVSASNVSVLLGNGTGGFGSATNFAAGNAPAHLRQETSTVMASRTSSLEILPPKFLSLLVMVPEVLLYRLTCPWETTHFRFV